MALVYNNQAKISKGQKQSRTRTDHHFGAAVDDRAPVVHALALSQSRMPAGGMDTETFFKTVQPLRRQGNFRHHNQHLAAVFQRLGHGLEINFGFAGTGNAVQQRNRKSAADFGNQPGGGFRLLGGQADFLVFGIGQLKGFFLFNGKGLQHTGINHGLDNRRTTAGSGADFGPGIGIMPKKFHYPPARVGIFKFCLCQRFAGKTIQRHGLIVVENGFDTHNHFERKAQKSHIIRSDESHEFAQRF